LQINKVANVIDEIIHCLKGKEPAIADRKVSVEKTDYAKTSEKRNSLPLVTATKSKRWLIIALSLLLCIVVVFAIYKIINSGKQAQNDSKLDKSIAVLPFVNDSPDAENEYFCNGMMEEIINQLQKISDLKVKARTSSEQYRNPNKDIKVIGKELGVSLIMEGSVRKIGDDLRITAQLIDAKTGNHLWSEIYDGKYTTEIFEFQSSIAKKVAASLNAVITPQEVERIVAKSTTDILAYDLYMKGHEMVRKFRYTDDSTLLRIALNLFDQALKIDPNYPYAMQGKGSAYTEAGKYDSALYYEKKAIEADQSHILGLAGIGVLYMYSNNPDSAFKYLQLAIDNSPNDPWSNLAMAQSLYFFKNEVINSIPYFNKAFDLAGDSYSEINENIAWLFIYIGDHQNALRYYKKTLLLRSEYQFIRNNSVILAYDGKYDGAFYFLDSICNINTIEQQCNILKFYNKTIQKDFKTAEKYYIKAINSGYKIIEDDIPFIAYLYKESGREKEALSLLRNSVKRDEDLLNNKSHLWENLHRKSRLAASYTLLNENGKALQYLAEIGNAGVQGLLFSITNFPGFDNLRSDPEFKAIVKRIKHEQDSLRAQVKEMELRGEIDL